MKVRKVLNFPLIGRFSPGYIDGARVRFIKENDGQHPNRIELPQRTISGVLQEVDQDMRQFETMFGMEIVIVPDQRDDIFRIVGEEEFHV